MESCTKAAKNTIVASSTIHSTAEQVIFTAGESVVLNPGFKVEEGVLFQVKNESCDVTKFDIP